LASFATYIRAKKRATRSFIRRGGGKRSGLTPRRDLRVNWSLIGGGVAPVDFRGAGGLSARGLGPAGREPDGHHGGHGPKRKPTLFRDAFRRGQSSIPHTRERTFERREFGDPRAQVLWRFSSEESFTANLGSLSPNPKISKPNIAGFGVVDPEGSTNAKSWDRLQKWPPLHPRVQNGRGPEPAGLFGYRLTRTLRQGARNEIGTGSAPFPRVVSLGTKSKCGIRKLSAIRWGRAGAAGRGTFGNLATKIPG